MKTTITLQAKNLATTLNKQQAWKMEIALNQSEYGRSWSKVGDALYNFHASKDENDITVTAEQYHVLVSFLKNE